MRGVQASACPAGTKADKTTQANGQLLQVDWGPDPGWQDWRQQCAPVTCPFLHALNWQYGRPCTSQQSAALHEVAASDERAQRSLPPCFTCHPQNQKLFSDFLSANTKGATDLQDDYSKIVSDAWGNFYDSNCGSDDPTCELAHEQLGR